MAITLENPEAEQALRDLSRETGESLTQAAGTAIRERLERVRGAGPAQHSFRSIVELIDEAHAATVGDSRPLKVIADELWGEGDEGPSREG